MVLTIVLLCLLTPDLPCTSRTPDTHRPIMLGLLYTCTRLSTIGLDSRVARIEWLRKMKMLCNVFSRSRMDRRISSSRIRNIYTCKRWTCGQVCLQKKRAFDDDSLYERCCEDNNRRALHTVLVCQGGLESVTTCTFLSSILCVCTRTLCVSASPVHRTRAHRTRVQVLIDVVYERLFHHGPSSSGRTWQSRAVSGRKNDRLRTNEEGYTST